MPLIRDLITIPEQVHSGDFVLQLADGVTRPAETVRDYVVTPQLKICFDEALKFIQSAIDTRKSKACYLHGSFGSGKSHFMAVLDLLLGGDLGARSIPELAEVVDHHNAWTDGKRFLMVPYHMIGATSLDQAIMGQYADHVRTLHPDAPVPGFYIAQSLFADAEKLLDTLGDAMFFERLNEGAFAGGGSGWGKLAGGDGGWDRFSFVAATTEGPGGPQRQRLVADLIRQFFQAYAGIAKDFVPLDDGLAIMSQHAKALGYDAVVLFLDELILWLATRAADPGFVANEGAKLSKLVEAANANRPIPLVSFVARQRDLRELVGDILAGSLQLQFTDVLRHSEARFHRITLDDRNLPMIASRRLLRPVSEGARATLAEACDRTLTARQDVVETLLTATGEREMFRLVYPFSPALVQTLVALSSVLQRERTALKLMMQLLVDRRDDLELGQIIPVGDLFDVIAVGDEPFADDMRIHFENARTLWRLKLLPLLERQHDVTWDALANGTAPPDRARNLKNDGRILKTLLLAALVPRADSLKALTAGRLAALNHGSVRSPIPGGEGREVLRRLKTWAAEVGEIKVTEGDNPVIAIQITGVDTDPIIANGKEYDNPGNRRRKIREMLFKELGIEASPQLFTSFSFVWRGTRREVLIGYENIRELSDDRLTGEGMRWTVLFDYPFDDGTYSPADDLARLATFRDRGQSVQTLVWLPSFLSRKAQDDLGRLIIIEELLKGDRFIDAARHLSPTDREQARSLLLNQKSQLHQRLRACLNVAYGIENEPRDGIGSNILEAAQHVQSLDETFLPVLPVGRDLKGALEQLLDQLFAYLYPAAPRFETEIRLNTLRKVQAEVDRALAEPGYRALVADKEMRKHLLGLVGPLRLGTMGTTHLTLDGPWPQHFGRCQAQEGDSAMTVAGLRRWIDQPERMGLPTEAQDLIILTYAGLTNRTFFQRGVPLSPTLGSLPDETELREQTLPVPADWEVALERAAKLFGLTVPRLLNAANAAHLIDELRKKAQALRPTITAVRTSLDHRLSTFAAAETHHRAATVQSCEALLAACADAPADTAISVLAHARLHTSDTAMAQTMARARDHGPVLDGDAWQVFEALRGIADQRSDAAKGLLDRLATALGADEHVIGLKPAIAQAQAEALALLVQSSAPSPQTLSHEEREELVTISPCERGSRQAPGEGARVIEEKSLVGLDAAAARTALTELATRMAREPGSRLTLTWTLVKDEGQP